MYGVRRTKSFERAYRKLKKSGSLKKSVQADIERVIDHLMSGRSLPRTYLDHELKDEFRGYRKCHIRGDLLLIYRILKKDLILVLVDLGSHSYLFG